MDNPTDIPDETPDQLKILELRPEPWPEDPQRIRVHVQITPFEQHPNMDLAILDASGEEIASVTIVEVFDAKFVITMHIRGEQQTGQFTLTGRLYFDNPETGEQNTLDQAGYPFEL